MTSLVDHTITTEATLTDIVTATETLSITTTTARSLGRPCSNSLEKQCNAGAQCLGSSCYFERTDYGQRCVGGDSCGIDCTTTDDCAHDSICDFNTCCTVGGACLAIGDACLNPPLVSRMFRFRSAGAVPEKSAKGRRTHMTA